MGDISAPITNEAAKLLCKDAGDAAKDFMFQQTMYRIKDPKKSIPFYTGVLGMQLLQKLDFPAMKFSLYFMGYEPATEIVGDLGSKERSTWALSRKATLELTHNWGTEDDPEAKYHNGNSDPRGFGHIGVMVPDVEAACRRFEDLKVEFIKKPGDGTMKGIAFIKDPDNYWIEIFSAAVTAKLVQK